MNAALAHNFHFAAAVSSAPPMIAPACPILLPGELDCPAMNPTTVYGYYPLSILLHPFRFPLFHQSSQ